LGITATGRALGRPNRDGDCPALAKIPSPWRQHPVGTGVPRLHELSRRLAHDPEKPAPHLMRGVQRFSEKIMRKQKSTHPHPFTGGTVVIIVQRSHL
jgi:hypothetical protein